MLVQSLLIVLVTLIIADNVYSFHTYTHTHTRIQSVVTNSNGIANGNTRYNRRTLRMHNDRNQPKPNAGMSFESIKKEVNKSIKSRRVLLVSVLTILPCMYRKKVTYVDICIFLITSISLSLFHSTKNIVKEWIDKIRLLQKTVIKHSKVDSLTNTFFFKNENAADRVTILGIWVNIVLSLGKFVGGIVFHSAVLVADAGHSLSDLFSDFITLWAVQVSRIPADDDHPYGHGKFESIGLLFLSLTLLSTGLSVGSYSYTRLQKILSISPQLLASTASSIKAPSWPALLLAILSIVSKEWLFIITKRIGEAFNSQILIANAWHHRSDAYSSVLSLLSIAIAIIFPQYLFMDPAGGILLGGIISLTGIDILFESIKQLSDSADHQLEEEVSEITLGIEGVISVKRIRARSVGSKDFVDVTILTDNKISASVAQSIAERVRLAILTLKPRVIEANVRTLSTEILCPLLSSDMLSIDDIKADICKVLVTNKSIKSIGRINIHFINSVETCVEIVVGIDSMLSIAQGEVIARDVEVSVKKNVRCVSQAEIHLNLSSNDRLIPSSNV